MSKYFFSFSTPTSICLGVPLKSDGFKLLLKNFRKNNKVKTKKVDEFFNYTRYLYLFKNDNVVYQLIEYKLKEP